MKPEKQILLVTFVLLLASCGSNKFHFSHKDKEQKEREQLSEQLGLEISKKEDLRLYRLIRDWYGTPHRDGGCDKEGTDCSCFVKTVYQTIYQKDIPRNSGDLFKAAEPRDTADLQEGDLVFFNTKSERVSHVGIYLKERKFVHVSTSKGVAINSLNEKYYVKTFAGAGRLN